MTRTEHIQWCKNRALKCVEKGNLQEAYTSISSDLNKHPETTGHIGIELGMMMLISGQLNTTEKMTKFIAGFN